MTSDTFSEREQAFENKFKFDEELRFKIRAKAISLFGAWAAGHLGLQGEAAAAYVQEIIDSDIDAPNVGGIVQKIRIDLKDKGLAMTERHLHNQFNAHQEQARQILMKQ